MATTATNAIYDLCRHHHNNIFFSPFVIEQNAFFQTKKTHKHTQNNVEKKNNESQPNTD